RIVTAELDVAPLHGDGFAADAQEATDRNDDGFDVAVLVEVDVVDLADSLLVVVAHLGANERARRHVAADVEVAGRNRALGGRGWRFWLRWSGLAIGTDGAAGQKGCDDN